MKMSSWLLSVFMLPLSEHFLWDKDLKNIYLLVAEEEHISISFLSFFTQNYDI